MADEAAPPVFRSEAGKSRYLEAYDAVLCDWPVPFDELDVATRLGSTHVIASGPHAAPPVILLHSLAASATLWLPNVAALSEHFRIYAVDVIGQTGKSVPARRIRDRHDMADWLGDVLDALGIRSASIVGSSYGGFLAMNQALLTPDRVERIVLISPAATFVGFSWKFHYVMRIKGPLRRWFRGKRAPDSTVLPGGTPLAPSGWGKLMSVTMSVSARPDLAPAIVFSKRELSAIRAPTLLLIGEREMLYEPRATLELAAKRMPGLTGAVIPKADHLASLSAPAEINERIIRFLKPDAPASLRLPT